MNPFPRQGKYSHILTRYCDHGGQTHKSQGELGGVVIISLDDDHSAVFELSRLEILTRGLKEDKLNHIRNFFVGYSLHWDIWIISLVIQTCFNMILSELRNDEQNISPFLNLLQRGLKKDRYVDALRGRVWALDMAKLWVVGIGVAYPSCDIAEYRLPLLVHLNRVR